MVLSELDESPCAPSPVERLYCEQRLQAISAMDDTSQMLIRELFAVITGEDDLAEERDDNDTFCEHNPGYEKSAEQRLIDCARVGAILASGVEGVTANLTWTYGETLLWMAIEYDHRHPPEMIEVLLQAGADANLPNAVDSLRPLQNPWLSETEDMALEDAFVAQKRRRLRRAGAKPALCVEPSAGQEDEVHRRPHRKRTFMQSSECNGLFSRSRSSLW